MLGSKKLRLLQPIAIAFFLSLITILAQPMGKMDRIWSDVILTSKNISVPKNYLIVEITPEDTRHYGGPPLPRNILAKTITRLDQSGAERILLDLTLSEDLSSKHDASLVMALKSLGKQKIALADGGVDKFNAFTTQVDLELLTDSDGWTRAVRTSKNISGFNPATWLATGHLSSDKVEIDLRYNPRTIKRLSISDILNSSKIDISGYSVIVSPNSVLRPSRIQLPLGTGPDRSATLILGSQSVSSGYQQSLPNSWLINVLIAFFSTSLGILIATFMRRASRLFLISFLVSSTIVGFNMLMIEYLGGPGYPIMQFTCFITGLIVTISYRMRLFQMIAGFLKGDLSPEEAWAWRAHEDSQFPVILLNSMGKIRRMNTVARELKTSTSENFDEYFQEQSKQRSSEFYINTSNNDILKFALEWPSDDVAIIILKDITEAERKFHELGAKSRQLERTADILRKSQSEAVELAETYHQKKNSAEAASEQKSKFLANMSHELRTPLNAINGFSDILNRELFGPLGDPRYKEYASNILFSGQHLLSLINDILDLSKIEAGKMKLNTELVEISDLISQSIRMVNGRAQEGGLSLIYNKANLPKVEADSRTIKQVLLNLLTNAIKFTPRGGVVEVVVETQTHGLVIYVADSGVGIPQEDIQRLAKPFEQVDNEHSKKTEGTGLGLALSKSFIELHHGVFRIESEVGKGTRITFTLPYIQAEQQGETPVKHQVTKSTAREYPVTAGT